MELVKPEPLIIGGHAHYTLTSYDPVSVEVDVRQVTEDDVDYAMQLTIMQVGGGPERLHDDAWIRNQFDGVHGASELRVAVRDQLQAMNRQLAEDQKVSACANALADRLAQRVPREEVMRTRTFVAESFARSLQQDGLTEEVFLATSGMRHADLEAMLDEQAQTTAEHEAAISAWVDHHKLQVADEEIPHLLGASPSEAEQFLGEMATMSRGQVEDLRRAALQSKAMNMIVAECSCTYRHETPAEATARVAHMQSEQQAFMQAIRTEEQNAEDDSGKSDHPHLKLV